MTYVDENGNRHYSIPKSWKNTTPVNIEFLKRRYGWREEPDDIDYPMPESERDVEHERIYSKLKVKEKLKFLGLWDDVMLIIDGAGYMKDADWCSDFRLSNQMFRELSEKVGEILPEGMTVADFLSGCEDVEKERLVYGEVNGYAHRH